MKSLAGLGILLFFTGQAFAAPPARLASAHVDSLVLVQLLHLDELLSRILNEHAQQAFAAGRVTENQLGCLKATPADFTGGVATAARRELTPAEITSATLMDSVGVGEFLSAFAKQVKAKCHITQPLQPPEDSQPSPDNSGAATNSRTGS